MTWDQLAETFVAALEVPPEDRAAWLDRACGAWPELRPQVEAMLREHESPRPLAIEARLLAATGDAPEAAPREKVGELVGPYRLLRLLGRGGMGEVYLAERADGQYRDAVAVKLLPGEDPSAERERRLRQERQILASLRHPGIAALYDGGVAADGRPYLVMEYVDGEPIDRSCDRRRLTVDERLRLFASVCDAVQYAHAHLVVHRDIKPTNLLVNAEGAPKLLDFGIAKLLDPPGAGPLDATRSEQRLFTPLRAAPEQIRGEAVSTATDVYALGLLLFELLTGSLPVRPRSLHAWEVQRAVCEDEPLRPTAALPDGQAASLEAICAARRLAPAQLRRRLRGDLAAILARALAKVPEARYPSAGALADDLRRHLRGEPVEARPQTWLYRSRTFVRRHAVPAAAVAAGSVALVAASLVAVGQARRAAHERDLAVAGEQRAQAAMDVLVDLFALVDPSASPAGDQVSVAELLARAERRAGGLRDPRLAGSLLYDLGRIQRERTDYRAAARLLERALATSRAGPRDETLQEAIELQLGVTLRMLGEKERAQVLLRGVVARRRARLGVDAPATLAAEMELAQADPPNLAVPRLAGILARQREAVAADSLDLAATLDALGTARSERGDTAGARREWEAALGVLRRAGKESAPEALSILNNLSVTQDDPRQQEVVQRRRLQATAAIFGAESVAAADSWNNLGTALAQQGRLREAEKAFAAALRLYERRFGTEHTRTANALRNVGRARQLQGRAAEALPLLRRALAVGERQGTARGIAGVRVQVTRAAWVVERTPRALSALRAAVAEVLVVATDPADQYRADALTALGLTLLEAGRACEAVESLRPALVRRGGPAATASPGPGLETRCALRLAERTCGRPTAAAELAGCAADLERWGLADPELKARFAAR